jgi:hypothetical protein
LSFLRYLHLFWKCSTAIIFALIWRTTVTFTVIGVLFCFWMFYCFTYLLLYCSLIFDKCYWVLTWNKFLCNNKTKQNNDIVEVKNCSRTFSWLLIFQLSFKFKERFSIWQVSFGILFDKLKTLKETQNLVWNRIKGLFWKNFYMYLLNVNTFPVYNL